MADFAVMSGGVSDALTGALLVAIDRIFSRLRPATHQVIDWMRDTCEPPAGLQVHAPDGALYSGLALLERSRVIVLLAIKVGHDPHVNERHSPSRFDHPAHYDSPPAHSQLFDDPGDGWPADPYLQR